MATAIIMPRQGQSVESCIITAWAKKVGDTVQEGDILFSYETDKSSFDEPAAVSGTVLAILREEGDEVPCLENVCVIGEPGEDISALTGGASAPAAEAAPAAPAVEEKAAAPVAATVTATAPSGDKVSPRARNLAEKTGADLSRATATGPDGRVIERDVQAVLDAGYQKTEKAVEEKAAAAAPEAPVAEAAPEYEDVKLTNIRKVIAKSMHASLANSAQLTLNTSFDATKIMAYRASLKNAAEKMGLANITLNDIVLFAVSRTLPEFKELNAHFLDDSIRYFKNVQLGVAVDTERGLMVPTVRNANCLSLNQISIEAKALIKEAQSGKISPDKLQGGSFTVTNLGSMGIESFTPVLNPPQVGILGVCTVTRRIRTVNGQDVSYPAMGLSLTFDHRAIDGAPAAKFLQALCNNLENFDLLLAKS